MKNNWSDAQELAAWRAETVLQVDESVATAQREPPPDPAQEDWCALATRHLTDSFLNE